VEAVRPTHLLHLAWIAVPGEFWTSRENLRWLAGGIALVDAFFRSGGQRALGVGTCAEYACGPDDCNEEMTPLRPDSVYGRCKLALSLAFAAAAAAYGGSSAWGRVFLPYGPGEPAERLVPSVIRGIVNGNPVDCTDGSQVRDFLYVDDAAAALVALLDARADGTFNIGSGTGMTLREVVAVITAQLGRAELVRFGARQPRAGDPDRLVADIGQLRRKIGWRPEVGIEEGIARTIAACRRRRDA
jgi:nucleoside-diphosphate-sugar epimerase